MNIYSNILFIHHPIGTGYSVLGEGDKCDSSYENA